MVSLSLQGRHPRFSRGRVTLRQDPVLQIATLSPLISFSLSKIDPGVSEGRGHVKGHGGKAHSRGHTHVSIQPFNIRRGSIQVYARSPLKVVFRGGTTNALQSSSGRVTLVVVGRTTGSVTKFTFNADNATVYHEDPSQFFVQPGTTAISANTGGPGDAWQRINAVVAVPEQTRFLGVGVSYYDIPDVSLIRPQHIKNVQVERLAVNAGARSFSSPREVKTTVQPDRLNWSVNPNLKVNTTDWAGVTRVTHTPSKSGFAAQASLVKDSATVTWPASAALTATSTLNATANPVTTQSASAGLTSTSTLNAGAVRTLSADLSHTIPVLYKDIPHVISFKSSSSSPTNITIGTLPAEAVAVEQRGSTISATTGLFQLRFIPLTTGPISIQISLTPVDRAESVVTMWEALVEKEGEFDAPYFDGDISSDVIWETGEVSGTARSYLYKNRLERLAALKRLLLENVPLGIGVAEPRLGYLPVDIALPGTTGYLYGSGIYGDGIYDG